MRTSQRTFTAILMFIFLCVLPANSKEDRRDGNWWRGHSKVEKETYMVGFFDGMDLGNRFSYWGLTNKDGNMDAAKSLAVIDSYNDHKKSFMSHVTSTQIADGLDKFYLDYRNRTIEVYLAVWLVLNSIEGKPDGEMNKMIELFRKYAK